MDWSSEKKVYCGGNCDVNGGKCGSTSMMSGRCGGWLAKRSIELNDSIRGGLIGLGVSGGGVTLGVVSGSIGEVACEAKGVLGGDSRGVDGGATL
nr:hypothetical protein [Tanacetum cinerariifolium]